MAAEFFSSIRPNGPSLSLRVKLTALVCAAILPPLLALSIAYERKLEADGLTAEQRRLETQADLVHILIEHEIGALAQAAGRFALDVELRAALEAGAPPRALRVAERRRMAVGAALQAAFDARGWPLAASAQDPAAADCLPAHAGAKLTRCAAGVFLSYGAAVYDDDGDAPRLLGWTVVANRIDVLALSAARRGVGAFFIADELGAALRRGAAPAATGTEEGFSRRALESGAYFSVAERAAPFGLPLTVAVFSPAAPLTAASHRRLAQIVGGGAAVTLLAGLAALLGVTQLLGPLAALRRHAHAVAEGDFLHRTPEAGDAEVRELAAAFNLMAGKLEASYSALESRVMDRTRALAESLINVNALLDVGHAMGSTLDLDQVLHLALHWAQALTHSDAAALFEWRPEAEAFVLLQAIGVPPEVETLLRRGHFRPAAEFIQRLERDRSALRVEDVTKAPQLRNALRGPLDRCGFHSVAMAALRADDHMTGVLLVGRRAAHAFTEPQCDVLAGLSLQAAAAIKNATLFQRVEEARRALDEANQHKSLFVAKMTHELRTPLSAIIGYTDILTMDHAQLTPAESLKMLLRVKRSSLHLMSLINDVLDLSKVEAGKLDVALSDVDAHSVILDAVDEIEPLIAQNGNRLVLKLEAADGLVVADPAHLRRALINLLSNALKFTQNGLVTLRSEARSFMLKIDVADTGVGIDPDHLSKLFQDFEQGDPSIHSRYGGAGLGLSLSRHVCQMMRGDITVESTPGAGSTFSIWLPLAAFAR